MGRNISVDHAAGPDEGILADRYAADDGTVSAERRAALHQRRTVFVLAGDSRARIVDVGNTMLGPQNKSSSRRTASYTETLFWIFTLLPMTKSLATKRFCPSQTPDQKKGQ